MNYRNITTEAYRLTTEYPRLHWFGFWPAVLDILVGGAVLFYQSSATLHHFFKPSESWLVTLKPLLTFTRNNIALSTWIAVAAILIFLLRLFVPVICNGGLIYALAAIKKGQPLSGGQGLMKGFLIFLPLFELTVIIGFFSLDTVLIEMAFAYRNLPFNLFEFIMAPLGVFAGIAILASLAMVYAEFFLVLKGKNIHQSITSSFRLVFENLRHTVIVGLLMLTIGIRILISVILIIFVPLVIVWLFAVTVVHLPLKWALGISAAISLFLLYFSGRLLGAIRVLVTGAWTLTFLEIQEEQQKRQSLFEEMEEVGDENGNE